MVSTFPPSVMKALPITVNEFWQSLTSTWKHHVIETRRPITLGLAISGGVDSMALASLCARLQSSCPTWRFRAFVVDHGARAGSKEEAEAVAKLVNAKGIDTKVLQIEWPKGVAPTQSSNFESLARTYRFRVLGEACRDSNLRNLLLAHHEDDQFETIMMRLSNGHKSKGLLGMKPNTQIPECYGIYGVYDSGAMDKSLSKTWQPESGISNEHQNSMKGRNSAGPLDDNFQVREPTQAEIMAARRQTRVERLTFLGPMRLEDGGIRVLRPLLQYSKERLIATCLQDRALWFEDHTNEDPTLTPRNAIRHIYRKHSIPAALQKNRIISLSSRYQRENALLERQMLSLLDKCSIGGFEPRVGKIVIRFPKLGLRYNPVGAEEKAAEKQEAVTRLLKHVINIVTPYNDLQDSNLDKVLSFVFPELSTASDHSISSPTAFTVAGVLFRRKRLGVSSQVDSEAADFEIESEEGWKQHKDIVPMQKYIWFLSRQPYNSQLEQQPMLEFPPLIPFKDENDGWKFFDGRYWIRVFNHTLSMIRVRPLRREDLQVFKELNSEALETFNHRLQTIARGKIRFTLPVIVLTAAGPSEKEKVLALPTLDIAVPGAQEFMKYEIAYKKVEWAGSQKSRGRCDDPASRPPRRSLLRYIGQTGGRLSFDIQTMKRRQNAAYARKLISNPRLFTDTEYEHETIKDALQRLASLNRPLPK